MCVSAESERCGGGWCKSVARARESWVQRVEGALGTCGGEVGGVSDRLVTTTRCTNTRLHCTRVMEVLMGGGEAVVGQTDKTVVGNGAH